MLLKNAIIKHSLISYAQAEPSGSFDMAQDPILMILRGNLPDSSDFQKIIWLQRKERFSLWHSFCGKQEN